MGASPIKRAYLSKVMHYLYLDSVVLFLKIFQPGCIITGCERDVRITVQVKRKAEMDYNAFNSVYQLLHSL